VPYNKQNSKSFWDHLNPHRLAVPRYQNVSSRNCCLDKAVELTFS
jgi:hypothetical protein